jgi:hypothetical protein
MHANNIIGRTVLIVDEIRPGLYAPDFVQSNMHPAKVAVVLRDLSAKLFAAVKDDQARREVVHKESEIHDIVSGKRDMPPFEINEPPVEEEPEL